MARKHKAFNPRKLRVVIYRGIDGADITYPIGNSQRVADEVATIENQGDLSPRQFRSLCAYMRRAVNHYRKNGGK